MSDCPLPRLGAQVYDFRSHNYSYAIFARSNSLPSKSYALLSSKRHATWEGSAALDLTITSTWFNLRIYLGINLCQADHLNWHLELTITRIITNNVSNVAGNHEK